MATVSIQKARIQIKPDSDFERRAALEIPGANWAQTSKSATLPLNLLAWHQVCESFPQNRHTYDRGILEWRESETEVTEFGRQVNHGTLEVWRSPDLWDTQAQAIERLLEFGSACIFDDRGMGKTRVAIEVARATYASSFGRTVVVCSRKLRGTWRRDIELWWRAEAVVTPDAATWSEAADQVGSAPITVLTYESLLNEDVMDALAMLNPEWLFVDEAHNVKKRQRKNKKDGDTPDTFTKSGALRTVPATHRVAMTGSPMPNAWHEVWAILNFVAPSHFTSYWHFVEALGRVSESFWGGKNISADVIRKDIWEELFDRWIISRRRPQHGKVWDFVPVELSKKERKAYKAMFDEWRVEMDGQVLDAPNHLARLIRLQQLAGGFGEWETSESEEDGRIVSHYQHARPSAKTDKLLEMLEGLDRAVVWTQYRNRAEFTAEEINRLGEHEALVISGAQNERQTTANLERFMSDEPNLVAVCVYGTISEGVNELVKAKDCFFLDWRTVKDVTQAADRLDRPGQDSMVRCVTLYAEGTVDEATIDREANKVRPLRGLLRSPEAWKFFEEISENSPQS